MVRELRKYAPYARSAQTPVRSRPPVPVGPERLLDDRLEDVPGVAARSPVELAVQLEMSTDDLAPHVAEQPYAGIPSAIEILPGGVEQVSEFAAVARDDPRIGGIMRLKLDRDGVGGRVTGVMIRRH